MAELSSGLCGVAGEFFVAAELSRRGYIVSMTLGNAKGIDIMVSNNCAKRVAAIQVKTNQNKKDWLLNKKDEENFADNLFYVFVKLKKKEERPDFYIVPSQIVANQIKNAHDKWLGELGRNGKPHNDTSNRKFRDADAYLEKWEILGL